MEFRKKLRFFSDLPTNQEPEYFHGRMGILPSKAFLYFRHAVRSGQLEHITQETFPTLSAPDNQSIKEFSNSACSNLQAADWIIIPNLPIIERCHSGELFWDLSGSSLGS